MSKDWHMNLSDLWYENAIIYCLDVETFMDSDGDGVGDFPGLISRLDYLHGLGVTCLWLMPFYPSPNRDDGYDVENYYSVDPRYGSLGDFVHFVREADERGMRVIIDLVVNHTSDQHPWFQAARSDPESPFRDYYVWREDEPDDTSHMVVFPGEQKGIWSYDEEAGAYYLHRFYDFQPDLNIANPAVEDEIYKMVGFWIELGISGFRLDAVPFLFGMAGISDSGDATEPLDRLRSLHDFLGRRHANAILLGEVDVSASTVGEYFAGGEGLHLLFNFNLNRFLFLALAHEIADPIKISIEELPKIPGSGQWVNFLRHHDELNLSRLTSRQKEEAFEVLGPDEGMQIFGRGLRRRLAPLLGGNRRKIELTYSLIFSLPGTPLVYYGEELGMGENLQVPGRLAVRTPMQWSDVENAGFSTADPKDLVRPLVGEGDYSYERANVADQRPDPKSLLNWMSNLIRARKECPEFGWGDWTVLPVDQPAVLAHRSEYSGNVTVAIHNLSGKRCTAEVPIRDIDLRQFVDIIGDKTYDPIREDPAKFRLEPYGYRWLRGPVLPDGHPQRGR